MFLLLIPIYFLISQKLSVHMLPIVATSSLPSPKSSQKSSPKSSLKELTYTTSTFTKVPFGTSVRGYPLISYESITEPSLPTFLIISNIHGNETIGYYIIQNFIDELENGSLTPKIDGKINFIIVPSVNPDGFFANTRYTADHHDPNRDYNTDPSLDKSLETTQCKQYFQSISEKYNMCFSINLHGGALCVSYPMDAHPNKINEYSISDQDEYYKNASKIYVRHHTVMEDKYTSNGGYINGADWYHIIGSIQDWLIGIGIPSITLELSRRKNPVQVNVLSDMLSTKSQQIVNVFWNENRQALIELIYYCLDTTPAK